MQRERKQKTEDASDKLNQQPAVLPFSLLVLVLAIVITFLTSSRTEAVDTPQELADFDFSTDISRINDDLYDYWPAQLYEPADFAAGNVIAPTFTYASSNNKERDYYRYGTYRLVLHLKPGSYALNFSTPTYAGKVWINGELVAETGTVSDNEADFVPKTDVLTVAFTATDQPTEFVIQRANFVHKQGGIGTIYLGPQATVLRFIEKKQMQMELAIGIIATGAVFFFGVFLFFRQHRQFLWFSLACTTISIRSLFVWPKLIMLLFPDLNWQFGHRLELTTMTLTFLFLLLFYDEMFHQITPKLVRLMGIYSGIVAAALAVFLPSLLYSHLTQILLYLEAGFMLVYFGFLLFAIGKRWQQFQQPEYELLLNGIISASILSMADLIRYHRWSDLNLTMVGMLILILLTSMALILELKKAQDELDAASQREADMRKINHTLNELSQIRTDFMANLSHELRTPLTVMASYAGLTKMQIEKGAVDKNTTENLDIIQKEAIRMGKMVEQLKSVSQNREQKVDRTSIDLRTLLTQAAAFCQPIGEKNRNLIKTVLPDQPLMVSVIPDRILQVLYNLIINANRHCRDSCILLKADKNGSNAEVQIIDNGDGMSEEVLQHVFERGFSKDGSSGLGLAVCQEIMEDNGGSIRIVSKLKEGTKVIFDLPLEVSSGSEKADSDSGR